MIENSKIYLSQTGRTVKPTRVRFAPSPTGFVHIGSLRTALYNHLFAKNRGGSFLLRIEDTDRTRFVEGATENLINVLKWAGISYDEGPGVGGDFGPYYQSQRSEIYRKYARLLLSMGAAYMAFDTPEELEKMRLAEKSARDPAPRYNSAVRLKMRNSLVMTQAEVETEIEKGSPYVIRLLVPENRTFEFSDLIRGEVKFDSSHVDDQVLIKSDGYPTYHLANVVDDHEMKISHIIRGEEWLSSVPKHLLLYEYFGWQAPAMAHLPLIFNPDGTKMSKRDIQTLGELPSGKVDPDVETYIKRGYEKEAILNYIALLGWNPGEGDERQIFSLDELVKEFSLERVNKSAAIFDIKKLDWLNSEHISRRDTSVLVSQIKPQLLDKDVEIPSEKYLFQVVELLKTRLHFLNEFLPIAGYFFADPEEYEPDAVKKRWKDDSAKLVLEFCEQISNLTDYNAGTIEEALRMVAERNNVGGGRIIHPARLCVTGKSVGPGLFEILEVLGKETVLRRLKKGAETIPTIKQ